MKVFKYIFERCFLLKENYFIHYMKFHFSNIMVCKE